MRTLLLKAKRSTWWQIIKLAGARWAQEDGDQRAAAFAYYLLLSILPLAILLVAAGSWFVEREVATQAVVKLGITTRRSRANKSAGPWRPFAIG